MKTYIYMVRHGESPYTEGNERTRGLTDKGKSDALRVTELLQGEGIEVFVSSPYQRALLTIQDLARCAGQEVLAFEGLKERVFADEDSRIPDKQFMPFFEKSFAEPGFALPGGESNRDCQSRAIAVMSQLLTDYRGKKMAIGTHGAVMTLMMGFYDAQYGLDFMMQTTKPDVYKMTFQDQAFIEAERMWHAG